MATVLYLNDTQVYPDGQQSIKLTRENPYFTQSDSYTLDVTLPMDILENRSFFKNVNRMECSKKVQTWTCRLLADNRLLLSGTARLTQVTEKEVKVQLLGGNSEINYISAAQKLYIDEMELGAYLGWNIWIDYKDEVGPGMPDVAYMPTYDETNGNDVNMEWYDKDEQKWYTLVGRNQHSAMQPSLAYVIKAVIYRLGYTLERCDFDREPWNRLFVASAKETNHIAHTLPHWTAGEFIKEVCNFFNCTFSVEPGTNKAGFISNLESFSSADAIRIEPCDEYSTEVAEDSGGSSLASSNIEFDLSSSPGHAGDCLSGEMRESLPSKQCDSKEDAVTLYQSLTDRMKYVYKTPVGCYTGWDDGEGGNDFIKVDHFAPLVRDGGSDGTVSLRICPVALVWSDGGLLYGSSSHADSSMRCVEPSLENPTGHENMQVDEQTATAQDIIEGNTEAANAEKEDRLQVMFIDDLRQSAVVTTEGDDKGKTAQRLMPFTDWELLPSKSEGDTHRRWSLSLNPCDAYYYLGQLHQNVFTFNVKAKHCFKFLADQIPDPTSIFMIRGKRYGCEKIEAQIDSLGMSELMTGYFYEIVS